MVVYLRCLLHNILSLIAYTFQENREFVLIVIVQFMMSSNSQMRFGLQILFVIIIVQTYLKTLKLWNACQIYFVECVSKIKHILSFIHYTIHGAVCFQFTHFPCDDWENVYTLSYYHHQNRKYEQLPTV